MKGKENVLTEVNILMICYNLRRLISILGIKELKNRLKSLVVTFFDFYRLFKAHRSHYNFKPDRNIATISYKIAA